MDYNQGIGPSAVLHWNYRGFTEFPLKQISGEEHEITDIYLKENLISRIPKDICRLESLYLSGNDIIELPREISKLKRLKCLDVSGNRLRSIPNEIGEVRSLKFLILDENDLTELPLRIRELQALRLLSVCDNNLQWLPQRPVFNYYHCELRFWRNKGLATMPYSLWYHMFRDQQIRSLNIGCLTGKTIQKVSQSSKCLVRLNHDLNQTFIEVKYPYQNVLDSTNYSPPSLYEISKRKFYEILSKACKEITSRNQDRCSYYSCNNICKTNIDDNHNYSSVNNLEREFGDFNINKNNDVNGNLIMDANNHDNDYGRTKIRQYNVPSDIVHEHYDFLPKFLANDIGNGPMSMCDNVNCCRPIFDYVVYEFCLGNIILIDNTEDIVLSATFCSKTCANQWKDGKSLLSWSLDQ